jgi:hypothetical protein
MISSVLPFLFNNKFISFSFFKNIYPYHHYLYNNLSKNIFILDPIIEPIDPFIDEIRFR